MIWVQFPEPMCRWKKRTSFAKPCLTSTSMLWQAHIYIHKIIINKRIKKESSGQVADRDGGAGDTGGQMDSVLLPVGLEAGFSGQLGAEVLLNYH